MDKINIDTDNIDKIFLDVNNAKCSVY